MSTNSNGQTKPSRLLIAAGVLLAVIVAIVLIPIGTRSDPDIKNLKIKGFTKLEKTYEVNQMVNLNLVDMGFGQEVSELWPDFSGKWSWTVYKIYKINDTQVVIFKDLKDNGQPPKLEPDKELFLLFGDVDTFFIVAYKYDCVFAKGSGPGGKASFIVLPKGYIDNPAKFMVYVKLKKIPSDSI